MASSSVRDIVIIAFPKAQLLDIAGPLQVFATAREIFAARGLADPYRLAVVSESGGEVETSAGLRLITQAFQEISGCKIDTLIAAGGNGTYEAMNDPKLVGWIAAQAPKSRRVCSVCSGTFLLAAAGLLEGKRCTTHWNRCAQLQRKFPNLRVDPDPIFVRDGNIWSSAGVTAGIDLALALVEDDLGRSIALDVARQLVVFLKRPGGQSQFSAMLVAQSASDDRFAGLHEWLAQHLDQDLRVERLAEQAGMSPRNFARLYVERVGTTPAKTVEGLRLEAARRALEDSDASIETIARDCGFGNEERMRRSFLRRLGVAPTQYRQRFSRPGRNQDRGSRPVAPPAE